MVLPACNPRQGVPVWQLGIDRLLHRNLVTQSLERPKVTVTYYKIKKYS